MLSAIEFCKSIHERFKILSVTGGVPRYLEEINPSKLVNENIKNLCFTNSGILFREFWDIFAKRSDIWDYYKIFSESKEFTNITEAIELQNSGHVSEYLSDLMKSGFVPRYYTWNIGS